MLFTDIARHISFVFLYDAMEQLPGRCSFGDQSFVLFIGRDMELASIHTRVSERLGINMQDNMLKYLLPMDAHVEQVLLDDGDVQTMFDLHKCQGRSFIDLQIHAVDTRCLSKHASRASGVLQTRMALLWKPQNRPTYQEVVWSCSIEEKERKNDSVRLTVQCNVAVCPWRLHASIVSGGPEFAINSLNNIHSCVCDIMSDGHPRTSKKWVANAVKGKLVDKPTYRASEMMRDIQQDYGISIPYHKHRVQGVILAASALNDNNELFTVAYSIEDSETYENWVYFLQNLKKALLSDRRIAFLSERGKGLKEEISDIFLNDHHGYYFQHIMQNFNDQCAGKYAAPFKKLLRKILQCIAYDVTEQEYQDALMAMELNSADAKEWVLRNNVDHWSHARFPGQRTSAVDSQEGDVDRWQQTELRFAGCVGICRQQQEGCRRIHTIPVIPEFRKAGLSTVVCCL
ncbi:hypothetical protein Taro_046287 [Colocasia esculenta]|uniref:MULE transposase domain-containing protein n=1 Tax=Colocasia esculenta TaxID=4460 RepID=A0A843WRX3_COLES|nr:hypothetical protein [Colocasia esculenta]